MDSPEISWAGRWISQCLDPLRLDCASDSNRRFFSFALRADNFLAKAVRHEEELVYKQKVLLEPDIFTQRAARQRLYAHMKVHISKSLEYDTSAKEFLNMIHADHTQSLKSFLSVSPDRTTISLGGYWIGARQIHDIPKPFQFQFHTCNTFLVQQTNTMFWSSQTIISFSPSASLQVCY